jgi:hypothetical protein
MTDRLKGYVVILEANTRVDDAQVITDAIKQLRGVLDVRPLVANAMVDDMVAESRVRQKFFDKFMEVMNG